MRHTARILLAALALATAQAGTPLPAQINMSGWQNTPRQDRSTWRKVSSEHFDIHYSTEDPGLANTAARFAEDALWDHCRFLDHNNKARFALYLFLDPQALAHSNMYPMPPAKAGGVTPMRGNAAPIVFEGSHAALDKRIRAEVAKLLMEDYYFGGGVQTSIQNTVLLHLPDWYAEGITAYMGEGWGYTDELWLHSLEHTDLLDQVLEGTGPVHRVARKSIWHFIAQQYGKEKVAEIWYMTRLARSAEDGVVHVLGITLKTLTERWREFVLQRITENSAYREPLAEQARKSAGLPKGRLMNVVLSPAGPIAALQVEHDGRQQTWLYDLERQSLRKTALSGHFHTEQSIPWYQARPLAWSPDGKQFVTTIHTRQGEQLALYDTQSGKLTYTTFKARLDKVLDLTWSHDGRRIALSALKAGTIDLYYTTPGSNAFSQLTDDRYDDLDPVFSLDDQRLYYASTRPNDSLEPARTPYTVNVAPSDVWEIELEGKGIRQVTRTPLIDERPVAAASSFEVLLRSNASGIWNLELRNVFSGDSSQQSNLVQGFLDISMSDSLVAFTVPEQGKISLYHAERAKFLHPVVMLKTSLRLREDKSAMALSRSARDQARRDSIARTLREAEAKRITEAVPDSSKKVKYYVFDEDGSADKPKRNANRTRASVIRKEPPRKPDFEGIALKGPEASGTQWTTDRITTKLGYDPVFLLNMLFEARLRDHLGNHAITVGFQPFMDLRSSETYLRYDRNGARLDWHGTILRSSRFLNRNGFSTRYHASRIEGGAILPLSRHWSAGLSAHLVRIDRTNLAIRLPKQTDGSETLAGIKAELQHDHTTRNGLFAQRGTWAHFSVQDVVSFKGRYNQFVTASWDLRKYTPVNRFVLATRLAGAYSAGRVPQRYFIGGTEDWLTGKFINPADFPIEDALADFHYMGYGTPVRGLRFNARNGTRYFTANAELRIPVSRLNKNAFNSNPLYNIEVIPFFDLGTAWSQGNPFSQRNPIDTEQIDSYPLTITVQTLRSPFVMGFGAGTRLQLFGYGVRFDLAWAIEDYTLQKPLLHVSLAKNF